MLLSELFSFSSRREFGERLRQQLRIALRLLLAKRVFHGLSVSAGVDRVHHRERAPYPQREAEEETEECAGEEVHGAAFRNLQPTRDVSCKEVMVVNS